jgi:hypothetical protein
MIRTPLKHLVFGLILLSSVDMIAADVKHGSCVVRVHDPEIFYKLITPEITQSKISQGDYTAEAVKMWQEAELGITTARLNRVLVDKLRLLGYTVMAFDAEKTRQYIEGTLDYTNDDELLTSLGLKSDELYLKHHLSFGFDVQPIRNERRLRWTLTLTKLEQKTDEYLAEKSYEINNLVKFTPKRIATSFGKALDEIPECSIVVE